MSSTVNLRVLARARAASRVCADLQIPVDVEAALARFGETVRTLSTSSSSLGAEVRSLPEPTLRALQTLAGDHLGAARELVAPGSGDRFVTTQARTDLVRALDAAQRTLHATSRRLLADDVVNFAVANGGSAEVCTGPTVTAVTIAADDNRTGVVRIIDGVGVDIEWQGLTGTTCQDWTGALTANLVANGWDVEVEQEDYHGGGRGDGERLIRPAAAQDAGSLARGVVTLAEQQIADRGRSARRSWSSESDIADIEGERA